MEKEFIPIAKYIKETGHSEQNVYRWIREGKVKEDDLRVLEKVVKVKMINKNLIIEKTIWGNKKNQRIAKKSPTTNLI